jgi:hypothetical protein
VEQQGSATAEIARNVQETATAANEMTNRAGEVSAEAAETGRHADEARHNSARLIGATEELRHTIVRVVRTSAEQLDRRESPRHPIDLADRVNIAGRSGQPIRVCDLSAGGACISSSPPLTVGADGSLSLDGLSVPLRFNPFGGERHGARCLQPRCRRHGRPELDAAARDTKPRRLSYRDPPRAKALSGSLLQNCFNSRSI